MKLTRHCRFVSDFVLVVSLLACFRSWWSEVESTLSLCGFVGACSSRLKTGEGIEETGCMFVG